MTKAQDLFVKSVADLTFFNGGAGSGHTHGILLDIKYSKSKTFCIFRKGFSAITRPGGLMDAFLEVFPMAKGNRRFCNFKVGDKHIMFNHMEHGPSPFLAHRLDRTYFDNLQEFDENDFIELLKKSLRFGKCKCTLNPYKPLEDKKAWLFNLMMQYMQRKRSYFNIINNKFKWATGRNKFKCTYNYINATIYDNKYIMENNPQYEKNLKCLTLKDREALLNGKWKDSF